MKDRAKKTLNNDEIATAPVSRRSALGLMGAGAVGLLASACGRGLRSGCTDSDPVDAAGRGRCGRSCTDSDPRDRAGYGRRC